MDFRHPGAAFGQPAVAGELVLAGGTGGRVFALDAKSGCTYWNYDAGALVRTGIVIDEVTAEQATDHRAHLVAWFGDDKGTLHAIDVSNGKRLWVQRLDDHPIARLVGTPQLHEGILYAPELVPGSGGRRPQVPLLRSAAAWWRSMPPAVGRCGALHRAPSAPVASERNAVGSGRRFHILPPTIDAKRGLICVGTGDSPAWCRTPTSNPLLKLKDGAVWTRHVAQGRLDPAVHRETDPYLPESARPALRLRELADAVQQRRHAGARRRGEIRHRVRLRRACWRQGPLAAGAGRRNTERRNPLGPGH
jgi:polyvinyl alcohol dehydrogenase (cytochrome)